MKSNELKDTKKGFITTNYPCHITHTHLTDYYINCYYKSVDWSSFYIDWELFTAQNLNKTLLLYFHFKGL